jgi:hypothetical protein
MRQAPGGRCKLGAGYRGAADSIFFVPLLPAAEVAAVVTQRFPTVKAKGVVTT